MSAAVMLIFGRCKRAAVGSNTDYNGSVVFLDLRMLELLVAVEAFHIIMTYMN